MSKSYRKHPLFPYNHGSQLKTGQTSCQPEITENSARMSETRKRITPPYQGSQQRLRFRQRRAFPFFRLPSSASFTQIENRATALFFRFVFQHHCLNNRQTALFKCRLKPHPPSARMLNQPLFFTFPVGFLHTLSFIVLSLTFCQTDFHLDFST